MSLPTITKHDDGTVTVSLPPYSFEVSNKEGTAEALIERVLYRVRGELEDHFELDARFIADGSAA